MNDVSVSPPGRAKHARRRLQGTYVLADDEEADTVGSPTINLSVHLGLCEQVGDARQLRRPKREDERPDNSTHCPQSRRRCEQ